MSKTSANVLVGVAEIGVKSPYDEGIAEFSTEQHHLGNYSAKLYKSGTGNAGSTHAQLTPPTGITMTAWTAGIATNSFWHHCSAVLGNFGQMEFRFEDPNSDAWAEITAVPMQTYLGTGIWVKQTLAGANLTYGWGGHTELDTPFFDWSLSIAGTAIEAAISALDGGACAPEDWILTRVRIELWEPTPLRTMYIDTVEVMGVTYTIEPGGTAPELRFGTYTDLGYTEDGVSIEYTVDEADIDVEEETFSIDRVITKEGLTVTCNVAESTLDNLNAAMAGGVLSSKILSFGGGVNKKMALQVVGITPAGKLRTYSFPKVTAAGTSQAYRKGIKLIVPMSFKVLKGTGDAYIIVDNVA